MSPTSTAPRCDVDFTDPAINANPFPAWEEIRSLGPVVWNDAMKAWMITGFDDDRKILRQADNFVADPYFEHAWGGRQMTTTRGVLHRQLREVFRPTLERGVLIDKWEPTLERLVRARVEGLAQRVKQGEAVEIAVATAPKIALDAILTMLAFTDALEPDIANKIQDWSDGIGYSINAKYVSDPVVRKEFEQRGVDARAAFSAFARRVLQQRLEPGVDDDDMLRRLVTSGLDGELTPDHVLYATGEKPMTVQDMFATVTMVIQAAQSNTVNAMSSALVYLGRDPKLRDDLRRDRTLMAPFIEELLRHSGVIHALPRIVRAEPYEMAGVVMQPGDFVYLSHAAANRDPSRWDNPEVFDIGRDMKANLSFGFGLHSCIGSNLGRMEVRLLVDAVLDTFGDFELANDPVPYNCRVIGRGPAEVLLRAAS